MRRGQDGRWGVRFGRLEWTRGRHRLAGVFGRVQVPETEEGPPRRGWRRPVAVRVLRTVTVHPPGRQPERLACVRGGGLRLAHQADPGEPKPA